MNVQGGIRTHGPSLYNLGLDMVPLVRCRSRSIGEALAARPLGFVGRYLCIRTVPLPLLGLHIDGTTDHVHTPDSVPDRLLW